MTNAELPTPPRPAPFSAPLARPATAAAAPASEAPPTHDYSAPLRLWHWANALLVSGSLLTILFLKVIVAPRDLIPDWQAALAKTGVVLSRQQGRELAHAVGERIWEWHIAIGLTLAGFWLLRVLLELRGPAGVRFSTRLLAVARKYRLAPPAGRAEASGELLVKISYALFYAFLTVMVGTGLALTWADDVAFLGNIEHEVKEIHEVTMYLILGFFALHLVGVVRTELTKDHGLISRMIGGK